MKVIIAGSRSITDYDLITTAVNTSGWAGQITEVVCGCADGVDRLGFAWARNALAIVPVSFWPAWKNQADWAIKHATGEEKVFVGCSRSDRGAGYARNARMADYADMLIAISTGSNGTANMISEMQFRSKPVFILAVNK